MLAGLVALVRQPAFAAADVEVAGLHHLGRAAVLRGAGLSGRPSVLLVSPDRAAAAIGADPWVRQVSVEALLPDTVRVTVVEWTPAAVLTAGAGAWLLTEQGTVLGPAQGAAPALVIHGPARALHPRDRAIPARLVADLDRIRAAFPADFGLTLTAFELDGGGRLVADTNGPRILFGQMVTEDQIDSLDAKLGALASLRAQVDLLRSGFDYINLMNPQQPATHVPPPSPSPSPSARPAPAASPGHH
jgi:cell division septal protein FtsQ